MGLIASLAATCKMIKSHTELYTKAQSRSLHVFSVLLNPSCVNHSYGSYEIDIHTYTYMSPSVNDDGSSKIHVAAPGLNPGSVS